MCVISKCTAAMAPSEQPAPSTHDISALFHTIFLLILQLYNYPEHGLLNLVTVTNQ